MTDNTFRERITSIEKRIVGDISPNERNPKVITSKKQDELTAVLDEFGKVGVLMTYFDNDGVERFFDGHARKKARGDEVWWVAQTDLSQKEVDDLVMLYDPLAAPDWDAELFKQLVQETAVTDETLTGMMDEIAAAIGAMVTEPPESKDEEPQLSRADELQKIWGVELGQMWRLPSRVEGQEHRLICGDCTDAAVVERVMEGEKAGLCLTDPPYGQNQEDVPHDSPEEHRPLIDGCLRVLPITDGVIISFQSPRMFPNWLDLIRDHNHIFERMMWLYKEAQMAFPWRGWILKSEAILVSSIGKPEWLEVHPFSHDCYKVSEVSFRTEQIASVRTHGSIKPLKVIQDLLSRVGGIVYEPFSGSGTTIIAAENLSRQCRAVEISPAYVSVALQRYQDAFNITPELIA